MRAMVKGIIKSIENSDSGINEEAHHIIFRHATHCTCVFKMVCHVWVCVNSFSAIASFYRKRSNSTFIICSIWS